MAEVRFFAAAKAATNIAQIKIDGPSVGEVLTKAQVLFPQLTGVLPKCSYLLNETACTDLDTPISPNDVLDVLPPFAGG